MPEMYVENRDMRCASDVGRMAALGRFDQEFEVYGCAYIENGEIWYRVSNKEARIYDYIDASARAGIYPTPVSHHLRRTPVPAGMQEVLMEETKLELIKKLKGQYSHRYFDLLNPLVQTAPDDSGFNLLWACQ